MDMLISSGLVVVLASLRVFAAFGLSPVLTAYGVPLLVRVLFSLIIGSAALTQVDVLSIAPKLSHPNKLISLAVSELVWGILLGLGTQVALAAFSIAGRIADMQSGLSLGAAFDPVTRSQASVISQIMSAVAVVLFFSSDAHLALIELLIDSYSIYPVGSFPSLSDPLSVARAGGLMFSIGFAIVAPVTLALLLAELLVGVISRNMPQMNVLIVAIPLKIWIAVITLTLIAHTWSQVVLRTVRDVATLGF